MWGIFLRKAQKNPPTFITHHGNSQRAKKLREAERLPQL